MDDLTEPNRNLRYGSTILAHYLAVERGDFTRALARYNGSLGQTWYPERVLKAWRDHCVNLCFNTVQQARLGQIGQQLCHITRYLRQRRPFEERHERLTQFLQVHRLMLQ